MAEGIYGIDLTEQVSRIMHNREYAKMTDKHTTHTGWQTRERDSEMKKKKMMTTIRYALLLDTSKMGFDIRMRINGLFKVHIQSICATINTYIDVSSVRPKMKRDYVNCIFSF